MKTERIEKVSLILFLSIILGIFIPIVSAFIIPFIVAVTFASIFYPVYNRILKHFKNRKIFSSLLTCAFFSIILLIPAYALVHLLLNELLDMYRQVVPFARDLISKGSQSQIGKWFFHSSLANLFNFEQIDWTSLIDRTVGAVIEFSRQIIQRTSVGAFGFVINTIIILFTMFYLFIDGAKIVRRWKYLIPIRDEYKEIVIRKYMDVSRATIIGTIIVGAVQGIAGALTLLIFGVEGWLLWGFVMVVLAIIPLLGPPLVLIPTGIYQLIAGNVWQGLGIILSSFLFVSTIDNFLRPRIVGRRAKIHDLIIFFSTIGGLGLFGIWGFIIGPVISALLVAAVDIVSHHFEAVLMELSEEKENTKDAS
jgi:predicted PurR-regulated permease PerM